MKKGYKIHAVWIHLVSWICAICIPLFFAYYELGEFREDFTLRFLQAPIAFYANYLFLTPFLLLKKRVWLYLISSITFLVSLNLILDYFEIITPMEHIVGFDNIAENFPQINIIKRAMPIQISFSFFLLGGIIKIVLNYYKAYQVFKEKEVERIKTELQYLKTQINPHFLFNSLNSIYSLVQSKSDQAPEAVLTLSGMMRYMLYEANQENVLLKKELTYIKEYVSLQKLRLSNSEKVQLLISGEPEDKKIHPFLLISFIENAFKYGINKEGITELEINITIQEKALDFTIKNAIGLKKKVMNAYSGIGLENIKHRLELLYKNKYTLSITEDDNNFQVNLKILL